MRGPWRLAYDNEVRRHASLKGHTLLTFAGGHMGGLCVSNSQFSRCIQDRGNVAWRLASSNEVRSHASFKGHTPSTFADGNMVARAELNNVR